MTVWQMTIDFTAKLDEDVVCDMMDALVEHGACVAPRRDMSGASVTMDVTANDAEAALAESIRLLHAARPDATVIGFEVHDWDTAMRILDEPLYPPVVGYAEIADMTGVSRQRAREFRKIPSFPKPVIETAQGPLYSKAAVESWARTRNKRAGRPTNS